MAISLEQNPFAIIGATTRDDKLKIVELAEEKSLAVDSSLCSKARADLTNPRNRLSAEIAWLPGVSPRRATELAALAKDDPQELRKRSNNIPSLALANLMASALEILDEDLSVKEWVGWIRDMAEAVEKIDSNEVFRDINEDRSISGFPAIKGPDNITAELTERNRYYKKVIKDAIDRLPSLKLLDVVTQVVEEATKGGKTHAPALIDDMVDSYALGVQTFLRQGADNILKLIEHITAIAPQGEAAVTPQLTKLDDVVRKWDKFAQPIQQSMSSRGMEHDISGNVAYRIRDLGIFLANEHGMIGGAAQTTKILQACFTELQDLADRVDEDAKTLEDMTSRKELDGVIAPIVALCDSAFQSIVDDPNSAAMHGERVMKESQKIFLDMQTKGLGNDAIIHAKNYVARTIMQCAIAYGNKTEKWSPCLKLLESAATLASEGALVEKIKTNIEVVTGNLRTHGGLGAISNAPSLFTMNGCGFKLYGSTDPDSSNGSHIATYYFVLLFFPIFPISRYRVIQNGNSFRFLGKYPLRTFDKWHLAIALGTIAALFLGNQ